MRPNARQAVELVTGKTIKSDMTRLHSPAAVANKFIHLATQRGDTLSPLQVIKLVYLAHGFMLGLYGRALVNEEAEAWTYGPVFRSLYRQVRKYGSQPVQPLSGSAEKFDELEDDIITQVYEKYGGKTAMWLSKLTHQPDSPWSQVWNDGRGHSAKISNDLLEDYYSRLAGGTEASHS